MPMIKKHNNRRAMQQRTAEEANYWAKQQGSKCTKQSCWKTTNHSRASCFIRSCMTSQVPHRLKKTSSMQLKHRNLYYMWLHCETKNLTFIPKGITANKVWKNNLLQFALGHFPMLEFDCKVFAGFKGLLTMKLRAVQRTQRNPISMLLQFPSSISKQ